MSVMSGSSLSGTFALNCATDAGRVGSKAVAPSRKMIGSSSTNENHRRVFNGSRPWASIRAAAAPGIRAHISVSQCGRGREIIAAMPETSLPVWAALTDEGLEKRLRYYLWLSRIVSTYERRVAQLIAEAERRGHAEMIENAKQWVAHHETPPPPL